MKKILFCLLILFAGGAVAQDAQIIKKDFEAIVAYTHQKNMDKVIDMTYPQIFKVMPKAQMKAMANGALDGMGIKTIFEEVPLMLKLSPVKKLKDATVCLGKYNQSLVLEFKNPSLVDMMAKTKMKDTRIEKLGANKLRMKGTQYLLAIKDKYTNNTWKYLRYDDEDAATNGKILSKEIITVATQLKTALTNLN
ncbi:hypothetical protein [Mucilaginibacter phyllosphaerae]|uniref:Uncharacterized protein n=1 Tax=Mucilaginibacter phyllosphaerae TaxID=1812349 RepID=A0A4Y8A8Y4_9SPHI|nr:hypothetical protein [Mucilaginibacter phyllosphaerae]MBB3970821.1 hypothetical protein [Mucilaginibacter phyllosphaerae]TEW64241.1 hypothetical protein E2R65_17995 [Mucilaginibacter phyllosphaerae]